jgi:hypothetical protein
VNAEVNNVTISNWLITDPSGGGQCKSNDNCACQPATVNDGNSPTGPTGLLIEDTTIDAENSTYGGSVGVELNRGPTFAATSSVTSSSLPRRAHQEVDVASAFPNSGSSLHRPVVGQAMNRSATRFLAQRTSSSRCAGMSHSR